jgi:hypothetical protein
VSNADLQFASENQYFRGVPPTFPSNLSLLDFLDFQIVVFNLQFHSSSNIFSSLYSDLQVLNSGVSSSSSPESLYVNPVTNQLISDFSVILDSFSLNSSSITTSSSDFTSPSGEAKKLVTLSIPFSILTARLTYQLPHFRVIDIQLTPNEEVRSFDAKLEVYFKNVNTSPGTPPSAYLTPTF